jgi:signal transduction histidine kinase/CheY-like chemotaxis protein
LSKWHPLLARKIQKAGIDPSKIDEQFELLLQSIDKSYFDADAERYTAERSFELSSHEMQALREHLQKERVYLQSVMSEGFCTVDACWQITSANKEAERLLNIDLSQVKSEKIENIINICIDCDCNNILSIEALKLIVQTGTQVIESRGFVKSSAGIIPISYSINPLPFLNDESFSGAVLVIRDISDYVKFETSLHDALIEAKKSNEIKGMFLANMSHEIRTPMNGVLGMLQLLLKTELTATQKEYISIAMGSGHNMLSLINEILDFSKLEANKISIEKINFDLRQELADVRALLHSMLESKRIKFTVTITEDIPKIIQSDPYRIRQIIMNLISNAIKFTAAGGTIDMQVSLCAENKIQISVADTGIGIGPNVIKKLFQPFSQADDSTTRRYGGTGLGLIISKKLVKLLDGEIWVDSEVDMGATFTFTFLFEQANDISMINITDTPVFKPKHSYNVLVVDDNPINQKVVSEMLKMLNCTVKIASNGEQAINLLKENTFDIVFMDCHMPVMDGFEATKKIREQEALHVLEEDVNPIKIIALTADAFESSREKCLSIGMNDFISKPFKMENLEHILTKNLT